VMHFIFDKNMISSSESSTCAFNFLKLR